MSRFSVSVFWYTLFSFIFCTGVYATQTSCSTQICPVRLPGACCFKRGKSCCRPQCPDTCHSIFIPRSPHSNSSYFLTHARCDLLEIMTSCVEAGYAYQTSFQGTNIATCMLGDDTLIFKGSQVPGRTTEIVADQFGLSPLFDGFVRFHPNIVNHSIHLQGIWYSPPASRCEGLFIRGQLTITHQTRSLFDHSTCFDPFITVTQGPALPPGEVSTTAVAALPFREALSGTRTFGEMSTPWYADRFTGGHLSASGCSGATIDIGYAAIHHDIHAFSVFVRYRPAVGTDINGFQKHASSLFFPVIGDGHFHEVGAGASMSGQLWGDCTGRAVVIHCEGYAVHLFTNCQKRSFDLKNRGCLSKYMLLKRFNKDTGEPLGSLIPAVNITTRPVKVSVGGQGEVAVQMLFKGHHGTITVGYEFYGKEQEKVCLVDDPFTTGSIAYGIKGCTGTDYFTYLIDGTQQIIGPGDPASTLSNATSTNSTIRSCAAVDRAVSTQTADTVGIDWTNPFAGNGEPASAITPGTSIADLVITFTSDQPQFLSLADIDICSGQSPKQVVHKGVLAYLYSWDNHCYAPYVSVGFEAEGSGEVCTLKQWSVWLKGGITF